MQCEFIQKSRDAWRGKYCSMCTWWFKKISLNHVRKHPRDGRRSINSQFYVKKYLKDP